MPAFLRQLSIDRISFWLGFLTGVLFLLFLQRLLPLIRQLGRALRARLQASRQALQSSAGQHLSSDTLRHAQSLHLASILFSLDEILIEPRLLPPPYPSRPGDDFSDGEAASLTLPYTPDFPELAATFHAPTFTLPQALSCGANLALIGRPGSGKTVALAYLACLIARQDPLAGDLKQRIPLLLHIAELPLEQSTGENPPQALDLLVDCLSARASLLVQARLPEFLRQAFASGQALLLLDGLDELPPARQAATIDWLKALLRAYPSTRAVAAAAPDSFADLMDLGLAPVALAAWDQERRKAFLEKWHALWEQFVAPQTVETVDPLVVNGWLLQESPASTPLDFTLKVWSAYAGDALGPGPVEAMQAYLRRMTAAHPNSLPVLQSIALEMVTGLRHALGEKELQEIARRFEPPAPAESPTTPRPGAKGNGSHLAGLSDLLGSGLLVHRPGAQLAFNHLGTAACLAACALADDNAAVGALINQPDWSGKSLVLDYWAGLADVSAQVEARLKPALESDDPLMRSPLEAARWLRFAPRNRAWRASVLRYLANLLQRDDLPLGLRAKALVDLVSSGESGLYNLFRQMMSTRKTGVRLLGVLGSGMTAEAQATYDLNAMLEDPSPVVQRAACLAFGALGDQKSLDALASVLLHAGESLRGTAAEILSAHPQEGRAILEEGAQLDDLLVRRAVVSALARSDAPWAPKLLEQMAIEDKEWVVKNAAQHALSQRGQPDPRLPQPVKPLHEVPWLIAYAGEQGIGVVPGLPARNLLLQAVKDGREEYRLAALGELRQRNMAKAIPLLNELVCAPNEELREAAYQALWHQLQPQNESTD